MKKKTINFLPVAILGCFCAILLTFPFVLKMPVLYSDNGDYSLIGWMLWYSSQSVLTGNVFNQLNYFNANQFYPFPYSLAYSENLFFPSLIFTPIYLLSNNLSFSVNLYSLLTLITTFITAFYFINTFLKDRYSSIIGAFIFSFNPVTFAHFPGHLHLESKYFLPLIFLAGYRFLTKPNFKDSFFFGSVFSLNAITGIHLGIFAFVTAIAFALPYLFFNLFKRDWKYFLNLFKTGIILLIFIPLVGYFYTPYLNFSHKEGIVRGMFEAADFSAKPLDYIANLPNNLVYGEFVRNIEKIRQPKGALNYAEHSLGINITAIILFGFGVFYLRRIRVITEHKIALWGFGLVGVASVILSFGPIYEGHVLPYYHINYWTHIFDGIRVPSRFQLLFYIPLSLICAYGVCFILKKNKRKLIYIFTGILFLLLLENLNIYEFTERSKYIPTPQTTSHDYSKLTFLKNQQTLHLPTYVGIPWLQNQYLNLSTISNERILNGYSGFFPGEWVDLLANTEKNFDEKSLKKLRAIGVNFIVIHKDEVEKKFETKFLTTDFLNKYRYFENEIFLVLSLQDITVTKCNLNKDIDFQLRPYQTSFGQTTTLFYRLVIKNKSNCYLASVLQDRYLEREFYFNGSRYTQNIKMPIVMEPFEEVIRK